MFNDTKAPSFQVNETHTFSPRMVSEARLGYQRVRNPIAPDPESATDWRSKLSLPAIQDPSPQVGFPFISLPGFTSLGTPYDKFLFGQDDFRLSQKLTLNLGMRWDVATAVKTTNHTLWVYDPARNANVPGEPPFNTDWNNFGPRFGFAYLWDDKTVLRGGYGISYFTQFKGLQGFSVAPPALQQHTFLTTDPFVAPFSFRGDFGKFLDLGNATTFRLTDSDFTQTFSKDGMPAPYLQSWNLTLERQLTKSLLLSASYVGNK